MTDAELVEEIKQVITDSKFYGEGHRKVWARLRYKGIRTSKARVLRLMRENGLCAKPCQGAAHGPRAHDGTIIPDTIDEMWGTDMTATLLSTGQQVAVFIATDHCSASCVGIHAATRGTRFEALQPIRQGVRECFGAIGKDVAAGLTIRHDNGSQYTSHDFQNEIAWLGAQSSPSFVRAPEGNGCAERLIRTLKENLLWVRTFDTIEELQAALQKFKEDYNEHWLIQRHAHRSPNQFRRDAMDIIPAAA
jgi:transposase InsO family protein